MQSKITVVSIIVENSSATEAINDLLHSFDSYIVGRMGIPYREKGIAIICIVMDASSDVVSSLSGKMGMLNGVIAKTVTAKK